MPFPRRVSPIAEAEHFCRSGLDKEGFCHRYIDDSIGYGLFTTKRFEQGNFLLEYRGQVSRAISEADEASNNYEFIYLHNGVQYRVDASNPDSCQARYINDDNKHPNCKMKKIVINNTPHLCLFAIQDIEANQELRYDYGQDDFPWRKKSTNLPAPVLASTNLTAASCSDCCPTKACLLNTLLSSEKVRKVKQLAFSTNSRCTKEFNSSTTHVITDDADGENVARRSYKLFQGLAAKVWVVSYKWVTASLKTGVLLPEKDFEIQRIWTNELSEADLPSRCVRLASTSKLFAKYMFYVIGQSVDINKDQVLHLLSLCGGSTWKWTPERSCRTDTNEYAVVFIGSDWRNHPFFRIFNASPHNHVPIITLDWVFDCIMLYAIQPIINYAVHISDVNAVDRDDSDEGTQGGDSHDGGKGGDSHDGVKGGDSDDGVEGGDSHEGGKGGDFHDGVEGGDSHDGGKGGDFHDGGKGGDSHDGGKGGDSHDGVEGGDSHDGGKGGDFHDGGKGGDSDDGGIGDDSHDGGIEGDSHDGVEGGDSHDGGKGGDSDDGGKGGDSHDGVQGGDSSHDGGKGGDSHDGVQGGDSDDGGKGGDSDDGVQGGDSDDGVQGGDSDDGVQGGDSDDGVQGGDSDDGVQGGDSDDGVQGGDSDDSISDGGDSDYLLSDGDVSDDGVEGSDSHDGGDEVDSHDEDTGGNKHSAEPQDETRNEPLRRPNRPCIYCGLMQTQLSRHLKRKHRKEEEVKAALQLPRTERIEAMSQIRKDAIFQENVKRIRTDCRQPLLRERQQGDAEVVMCGQCHGFYSCSRIWRHKQVCHRACSNKVSSVPVTSLLQTEVGGRFNSEVLLRFRNDDIGSICRSDPMIVHVGKKLWAKSVQRAKSIIMNDMRKLGNLLHKMRCISENTTLTGEDILKRQNFSLLENALDRLTDKSCDEIKAGLRLSLGYLIKKGAKVMKAVYIMNDRLVDSLEIDRFLSVLDLNWDFLFSRSLHVVEAKRQAVLRKPQSMPLEEDISRLRSYIVKSMEEIVNGDEALFSGKFFNKLRSLVVSRLTFFNARRGGEPCRMTLSEWEDAKNQAWVDPQQIEAVKDPLEKALMNSYKLAYQRGKGSRKLVPVLIPNDTVAPIEMLVKMRNEVGVSTDNVYLFPFTQRSAGHVNGWAEMKKVTDLMGEQLKKPSLLTATKFRHRASTLYALLDVPEKDRTIFYKHMGHSAEINANIYQCPLAVREITSVGRYLQGIDGKSQTDNSAVTQKEKRKVSGRHISQQRQDHLSSTQETDCDSPPAVTPRKKRRVIDGRKDHPQSLTHEADYNSSPAVTPRKKRRVIDGRKDHPQSLTHEADYNSSPAVTHLKKRRVVPQHISQDRRKAESSSSSTDTTPHKTRCGIPLTLQRRTKQHSKRCHIDSGRGYTKWSAKDTAYVREEFKTYIMDKQFLGSKGSLPGKIQVENFMTKFPHILKDVGSRQKVLLIKTKVFNERGKERRIHKMKQERRIFVIAH